MTFQLHTTPSVSGRCHPAPVAVPRVNPPISHNAQLRHLWCCQPSYINQQCQQLSIAACVATQHQQPSSGRAWLAAAAAPAAHPQRRALGATACAAVAATAAAAEAPAAGAGTGAAGTNAAQLRAAAQQQSLGVLEWQAVCRQVGCFCGTSMAAEQLLAGQLHIGSSEQESELLLQQTAEAIQAALEVTGVYDLRPALEAAAAGGILNARQLEGVASSMESAFALKAAAAAVAEDQQQQQQQEQQTQQQQADKQQQQQVQQQTQQQADKQQQQQQQQPLYPCLAELASGIQDRELRTLQAIRSCISDGSVLSRASPELSAVREARQQNRDEARALATKLARELYAQGAAEGREPLLQRGRYCVALKRSSRSAVSRGSVKLGQSGTGATVYVEPVELLELNNREAALADQEAQAELAVLQALSQFLAERGAAIQGMLQAVTALDIVAARAKHAQWCQGVRPVFVSHTDSSSSAGSTGGSSGSSSSGSNGGDSSGGSLSPLHLPGARHPLLLQPSLPPLPRPPSADDASFETDYVPPPLFAFAAATSSNDTSSDSDESASTTSTVSKAKQGSGKPGVHRPGQGLARTAKPLDIRVPDAARVVAITGPNTGGKTVTLKTAGLFALMAKAGLFLPCDQQELQLAAAAAAAAAGGSNGGSSGSNGGSSDLSQPRLQWFDQVLADIGDSQSLQQNLSTFSGHIARLKLLLAAAGPDSLVLLDEVGSGTDPLEGSALARAVLDVLAAQARLTLATSHHAELKVAAEEDSRYVNVSLEFNTLTLQPTYKLCWGAAGSSNALDIATALGFDAAVLADARILARAEISKQEQQQGRMEQVAASVEDQIAAARASIGSILQEVQQREQAVQQLQGSFAQMLRVRGILKGNERLVQKEAAEAVIRIQQAAVRSRQGTGTLQEVQEAVDEYAHKLQSYAGSSAEGGVRVGDRVMVPSMGVVNPFIAQVAKVSGDYVWLEGAANPMLPSRSNAGLLKFRVDEVVPASALQLRPGDIAGLQPDDMDVAE